MERFLDDRPWIAGHALLACGASLAILDRLPRAFPIIFAVGDLCAWLIWTGYLDHFQPREMRGTLCLTIYRNAATKIETGASPRKRKNVSRLQNS